MKTSIPPNEAARINALNAYAILDTPAEGAFDDLVRLAAIICDAPMAAVSLVDSGRQWFKARLGIQVCETDRNNSFCTHGIAQERELFIVPDARLDPRFAQLPLVQEEPHIQFYAGVRLVNPDGHALGMLCVMDRVARELNGRQTDALQMLAQQVVAQLELRRGLAAREASRRLLEQSQQELRAARDELENRVRERTAELEDAIGSLKSAEREATEWKNRYDLIVASSGLAVYDIDRLSGEVFWGSGASRVLGLEPATLNRARDEWLKLVHPQDRGEVMRCIEAAVANGVPFDVQYRLRHGMDHYRWIQDRGFVVPDAQGRCIRVLGLMQDVTQRRLAEDTMREQAALLDQTQDAIMVRDLDNRILYWNQTAQSLYGWTYGEALGKPVHELLLGGDLTHLSVAQAIALKQGRWSGEVKVFTKAGKELTVNSRWTMLRDRDGKPNAFLIAHTDLTERKLLEAKFLRAQRLESVGAIASGIAHDLNNVFTPILMSAQLLGDDLDEAARASTLGILKTSARRGSEMVKQVLTFARGLEAGLGLVQVKHLLDEMESMMRDTFPHNIRIEKMAAADLWPVHGDVTQLYQVLMNLCVNSRDAMPGGGTLRLEAGNLELNPAAGGVDPDGNHGPHVCITVADNGAGMSPEVRQRIFEPFFTTKEPGKGTGLGLSTVMTLVQAHGGFVEVETKAGAGTRFKIFLPAERAQSAEPDSVVKAPPDGHGELLLVVDDESAVREILKTTLEAHDYDVLLAEEGTEALALYAAHREKIALVVTDIAMPVLDGHATIRALRKMNPDVKLIAVSGLLEPGKLEQLAEGGATLLAKPFSSDKLLNTIHDVLNPAKN